MTDFPARPFLLFAGPQHYPSGGWSDLRATFETADDAIDAARSLIDPSETGGLAIYDWWHVVDSTSGRVVCLFDVPIPDAEHVGDELEAREIDPHTFVEPDDVAGLPEWAVRCAHCGHPATFGIHEGTGLPGPSSGVEAGNPG